MTLENDRHITLEGSSNLRDIGGYAAEDGRTVRWGKLYRSGALGRLSASDWEWMVEHDIGSVCDLRSGAERVLVPTIWKGASRTKHVGTIYEAELIFGGLMQGTEKANIGEMGHSLYLVFPTLLAPSLKMMFDALLDGHAPLIVHCSAGQDRTGLAVGLLLSALGVPRPVIYDDYLLSTDARRVANEINHDSVVQHAESNLVARFYATLLAERGEDAFVPRRLVTRDGTPLLAEAFAHIEAEWGSIGHYFETELNLDEDRRRQLQDMYLESA